ncbi:hypothetical protein [Bradyrhizobium sp.]|uniref:hypothetical protein n=1 Tax=Bradyrhizobium sp. TaxID=376 RepID=UPI003C72BB1C
MHGSLDQSGKNENSIYQRWGTGFLTLPALLVIALITLALAQPAASNWISEAVQAEVAGFNAMPELAPTQLARPTMQIRTVRAN